MALTWIWTGMIFISLIYSVISGNTSAVSTSITEGATAAVKLCIELCGITCFWCGIMKVFERCGILKIMTQLMKPIITKLLPETKSNSKALEYATANISSNLLGLGNAATPLGLKTIASLHDGTDKATDDMCTFTVLNTASIQLVPITVAAIRMAAGAHNAFDILPAVWITSLSSAVVGIITSKLMSRIS